MLEKFEVFVKKNRLFNRKTKLLLALSGGEDSVCLFHILRELGYNFSVAHCNFKLRGKESDDDEKFVRKLASKYKIEALFQSFDTKAFGKVHGLNTQESARFLRYQWFDELINEHGFKFVLTAHHIEDNAETMLINLSRATGISGLHGIPIVNGNVCRPLLGTEKQDIVEFLQANGYKYRTDSSNLKDDYLRNKIRHNVIPQLKKIDQHIARSFYESAHKILEYENMAKWLSDNVWQNIIEINDATVWIKYSELKKIPSEVLPVFLYECLKSYGFNRSQSDAMCHFEQIQTGFILESANYQIIGERHAFLLKNKTHQTELSCIIKEVPAILTFGDSKVELLKIKPSEVDFSQLNCLYFDSKMIQYPLTIREWKKGDKMRPLGMKGFKKISDMLTDKKVPHYSRKQQYVISDTVGELIALLPNTVSDVHKVRQESIEVLRFRLI